jgi:hypothetical protein
MHFKIQRQWSQMWIDRSMVTMCSGPIYEADSHRGQLRFIYLNNDSSYPRGFSPFHVSCSMGQEGDLGIPGWSNSTRAGFGIDRVPVAEVMYNLSPGTPIPVCPRRTRYMRFTRPGGFGQVCGVARVSNHQSLAIAEAVPQASAQLAATMCEPRPDRCPECGTAIPSTRASSIQM